MADDDFDTQWLRSAATRLGVGEMTTEQIDAVLTLAGGAAHRSGDRRNAPLACFLVGLRLGSAGAEPTSEAIHEWAATVAGDRTD